METNNEISYEYRGIKFTVTSSGKGSNDHGIHVANGEINGVKQSFVSTSRKQAKDIFKKEVRKSQNQNIMKTEIKTLEQLCEFINSQEDYPAFKVTAIIEKNGWKDLTHETYNVCEDSNGNRVELGEDGICYVVTHEKE